MVKITQMKKTTLRQAALRLALVALAVLSPLGLRAQETLPLYETASDQNQYVPFYGYYGDEVQTNQLIYPASELSDMDGGEITQMVFYVASQSGYNTLCDWVVSIGETSATTLSGIDNTTTLTQVYSGAMTFGASSGATTMTIVFDQPYTYNGGNLLIQFNNPVTNSSAYHRYSFTGIEATGASYCYGSQRNFLPKVTFTYEPAQTGGCTKPGTITLGTVGATQCPISWTAGGEETSWNVYLTQGGSPVADYNPLVVNTTPSCTFTGLTAGTTYDVAIEAICGDEVSNQRTTSFATEMCEPTDMCQISVYRYDQYDDSWNGGSIAIMQNGNLVATVNCPSGSSETTVNYTVCKGVPVSFVFTRGNYPGEIGVTITDGGGEVVYEATSMSSVSAGTFLTIDNACPSCYKVLNLTPSDETTDGVTLTWEADTRNDAGVTYTIFNVTDNVVYASGVTATSQIVSGLNENTPYVFTVTTDCGSGDLADAATVNFTTLASCPAPSATLTDGTVWAHGATIGWNDMGSTSYNVRYQVSNTIVEDFESGVLSNGWSLVNSTSSSTQVSSSAAYNGSSYGFLFYYSEQNDASLISPVLNGTENGVSISFYYKEYSDDYGDEQFHVGYSSDENATDPDDFTYGDIVTASTSWQQYENTFPAGTKRIAIKYVYNNALYLYIDDINIVIPNDDWTTENTTNTSYPISNLDPETRYLAQVQSVCGEDLSSWSEGVSFTTDVACVAPTSLAKVGEEGAHQVALTWNENGANTNWQICLNGDDENPITVTGATHDDEWHVSYTLTGLNPDQEYTVKVRSNCGDEGFSQWSNAITIHTTPSCYKPTAAQVDEYDQTTATISWTRDNRNDAGETYSIWMVPGGDDDPYVLNSTTTPAVTVDNDNHTASLTGLTQHTEYVFWVGTTCANTDESVEVVPVNFTTLADCPIPVLEASGITDVTAHTANVAWTGNDQNNSYTVSYRTAATTNTNNGGIKEDFNSLTTANSIPEGWSNEEGTTTTASYKWCYVTSGSGNGATNGTSHDNSNCVRFNSYSNSNNNTNFLQTPSMDFPAGETMVLSFWWKNPAAGDFSVYISTDGGTTKTPIAEGLTGQSSWTQSTYELADYIGATNVTIHFKGTSNWGNGNAYIYLDDVKVGYDVPAGDWQTNNVTINEETAQITGLTAKTTYEVKVEGNCANDVVSDPSDIQSFTTTIACPAPVLDNVDPNTITTTTATLTWTGSAADNFTVAYKAAGEADFTEVQNVTGSPFTFDANTLTPATAYTVKVKAVCGQNGDFDDGESEWSNEKTFTTECVAVAANGWSWNFDDDATGSLPTCWNRINEGTSTTYNSYPRVNGSNSYSSPNCLYFYTYGSSSTTTIDDQYAVLPEMTGLAGMRVTMQVRGYNATSTFKVGTMSDPTDAITFVEITNNGNPAMTTSYQEYTFDIPTTATDRYVAIMMPKPTSTSSSTYGVYIDDISIAPIPACDVPSFTVTEWNAHAGKLNITAGASNETAWDLYFSTENTDPDDVTTPSVSNTTNATPWIGQDALTAATTYYVWVRAHCSETEHSDWYGPKSFTTECAAKTITATENYTENFDSYTATSTGTSITLDAYNNWDKPLCWEFPNRDVIASTSTYPQVYLSSSSSYAVTGNCLFFKSSSTTPMYAVLPEFTNNISDLMLTFTYRNEGTTSSNGTLVAGYMTDPTDASTFDTVLICDRTTTKTTKEMFFDNAPVGSFIAFKYQGTSNNYYLSIDDVVVELAPACRKPKDLALDSKTAHTATMSWTNGTASQTAWQIAYSTDENFAPANDYITPGENEWLEDVTDNPAQISNLTHNTTYYAYVRANCGTDGYSDWCVNTITFATDNATVAPTNLAANGISSVDATISWTGSTTTNVNHESYELYYSTADVAPTATPEAGDNYITDITATSQLLDELDPSTEYYVWVRDNCGIDGKSAWTGMTFTTLAACPNPTNLTAVSVAADSAIVVWDGNTENDSYMLKYRKATTAPVDFNKSYNLENGSMPEGWTHIGNGTATWQTSYSHSTSHSIKFSGTTSDNVLVLPSFEYEVNVMTISYWSKAEGSSSGEFDMGYVTDPTDVTTFHAIHTNSYSDDGTTYTEVSNISLSEAPDGAYIAFRHRSAGSYYYWFLDDIQITATIPGVYGEWQTVGDIATNRDTIRNLDPESYYEVQVFGVCSGTPETIGSNIANFTTDPSCLAPTALTVGYGNTYADLSWTRNSEDETSWQICFNGDEDHLINVTTETAGCTVNGNAISFLTPENTLTPSTDYTVKVRTYCSASDQSAWSNEVSFTTMVSCPVPTNLEANNMTTTSADLSWTAGLNETEWTIYYKKTADENYTAETGVTENPYTLPGLEASTQYEFYVTANCSETEESAVSTTYTFYTACDAITSFPWSENFDTRNSGNFSDPCWVNEHVSGSGSYIFSVNASQDGNTTRHLKLTDQDAGTETMLRLPEMNLPDNNYQFVIDIDRTSNTWQSNPYELEGIYVYVSTDGNLEGATELAFIPRHYQVSNSLIPAEETTGWYTYEIPIGISGNCYIILKGVNQYVTSIYVDNFKVRLPEFNDTLNGNSWYAISSPVNAPTATSVTNLIATGDDKYDFFRYDEATATWQNYKVHDFDFENGRGYIYRRTATTPTVTLTFTGTPNDGNNINVPLSYTEAMDEHLKGFNLIGNPYTTEYALGRECYSLNTNGTWVAQTSSYLVQPFEAVMVQADEAGTYTFTNGSSKDAPKAVEALAIKVNGNGFEDVTYAKLENGKGLYKINHLAEEAPALSIAANGSDYAIAYLGYEVESFPLTLNAQAGTYTIALNSQISSLSYVHLIDNLTGKDIDLLSNAYTFTTDGNSANRFLVKLSPSSLQATEGEIATWNGNSWTVKGEGTLQLFDVMGRKVLSQEVSELSTINTDHLSSGVYVIRLGEKSQKIVVK